MESETTLLDGGAIGFGRSSPILKSRDMTQIKTGAGASVRPRAFVNGGQARRRFPSPASFGRISAINIGPSENLPARASSVSLRR